MTLTNGKSDESTYPYGNHVVHRQMVKVSEMTYPYGNHVVLDNFKKLMKNIEKNVSITLYQNFVLFYTLLCKEDRII